MLTHLTTVYLNRSLCGSVSNLQDAARRIAERSVRDGLNKTFVYVDRKGYLYASRQGKSETINALCLSGRLSVFAVFVDEGESQILATLASNKQAA